MYKPNDVPVRVEEYATQVIGAAIEVHRALGRGFLESIYEAALAVELRERGIAFERQVVLPIEYRGVLVGTHRLDLLVCGELVIELKSAARNHDVHVAQVLSYLKAGAFPLGLILNFDSALMKDGIRRVVPLL
ncbi:MAG: GxxExxY protein [Deltaproteobacteria bacterium]|nr:GxxExxY protein [Deltaproteobacteria bacterium]